MNDLICVICGGPFIAGDWSQWEVQKKIVAAHETCVAELLHGLAREVWTGQSELFIPPGARIRKGVAE
jgi:hypothetical protein